MFRLSTIHGQQIDLESGGSYVLGRGPDCDVVVEDLASSRRHACIHVGTKLAVGSIVDLDSRNGTFVDEQPIVGMTPLHHGNRVRIGVTLYLVVTADADGEDAPLLDTKTQAMEHLAPGPQKSGEILRLVRNGDQESSVFAGQLGASGVVDILQALVQTNRSGALHLAVKTGEARVEIRAGEVVSAFFDELTGLPALRMLAKARSGLFWFVESGDECLRTIHEATTHLLLELGWDLG